MNIIVTGPLTDQQRDIIAALERIRHIKTVFHFATGEETINFHRKIKPSIIFIDIIMRGMTGIETARWIKEQDKGIKIILYSSNFNKEFVFAGMKNGLDGYIKKNSDPKLLRYIIKAVLSKPSYFIISNN